MAAWLSVAAEGIEEIEKRHLEENHGNMGR
jgi:hypothetical protein